MDIMDTEPCVESPPTGIAKESQTESNLASTSVPGSTLSSEASPAAPNTDAPEDGAGHRADLPTIEPMELPTQNPERHTTPLSASGSRPMTPNQPAVIGGLSPPSQVMPNAIVLRNPVVEAQHATSFRFAPRQIGSSAPISKSRPHLWRPKIAVKITAPYLNGPRPPVSNETDFGILMLTNPSLELPCTTDTLQARLHFIRPWGADEVRRHTASSLRFVIRGNGGSTMINEQIIEMRPHDVIVTPRWAWHNTFVSTQDKECVIFLDVLDVPAFQHFPGQFIEHRTAQPTSSDRHEDETTQLVYLWTVMKAALDTTPDVWASREYKTNSGSQLTDTLRACAERIIPAMPSPWRMELCSSVYHVIFGEGTTTVMKRGEKHSEYEFEWSAGDKFCIPSLSLYRLTNKDYSTHVYLFRADDSPMIEKLGFHKPAARAYDNRRTYLL